MGCLRTSGNTWDDYEGEDGLEGKTMQGITTEINGRKVGIFYELMGVLNSLL